MISLYRWKTDQPHGTWVDFPELPGECLKIPEGEIWWLDLDDASERNLAHLARGRLPQFD